MNTPTRRPSVEDTRHIKISLEGSPDEVERMLQRLAGGSTPDAATHAPEPLFVTRDVAAAKSGISPTQLSNLVKLGRLTNHGTSGKMLFNLAEIRAFAESQVR